MNVQKLRESLKRDVFKLLSNRPDGIPVEELWSEVSSQTGHEIRAKDFLVPNLSYFLYLWESDFRITDNRVFLRNAYFTSQVPMTAGTSFQSTNSSSASYEVPQHKHMQPMSSVCQDWMINTQNMQGSNYDHAFGTTHQPGTFSAVTFPGKRSDVANNNINVNVSALDHKAENMVQNSDCNMQSNEYGWQNKSYNLQNSRYGTQTAHHEVKDNQYRARIAEHGENVKYSEQNMGNYPSYSANTITTVFQSRAQYGSENVPQFDSFGNRPISSYQMPQQEVQANRSISNQIIRTGYEQELHNVNASTEMPTAMDLLKRTGGGPRSDAPVTQGNSVPVASMPHTRCPSAQNTGPFPQQYHTQQSYSATTQGNMNSVHDTQQYQGSQYNVFSAHRGSRHEDECSTGQKVHHDMIIHDRDLKSLQDFIITKLKDFRRGINLEHLYDVVLSYGKGVETVIEQSGSFQQFLGDYMGDVLSFDKSNMVCLFEYQTQNNTEVIDLTGVTEGASSIRAGTQTSEIASLETPLKVGEFQKICSRSSKKEKCMRQLTRIPVVQEDIALKARPLPLEGSSYSQEVCSTKEGFTYSGVSHEELANLRNVIISKLEGHSCGIRSKKLITKLESCRNVLDKVLKESGSFLQFLEDQMSDVLLINKSQVVCLRQYQEQSQTKDHVIDLTNENMDGTTNENNHIFQQNNQGQLNDAQSTSTGLVVPRHQQRNVVDLGFDTEHTDIDVRPIVKKEFEKREIVVVPLNIPRNVPVSLDFVNTVAVECIETLSNANEFVMPERVEKMIFQRFQIQHPRQIGLNSVYNIPCIDELKRLLNKIHGYIIGFVKTRPICTLYELEDAIKNYVGNHEDFSSLKVGPLQRSPVVFQHFKFPPDQEIIPAITSTDVLEHFQNFMNTEETWKPELEPFMEYLANEYSAEDAYYLGVRIISLPFLASILRKAHYDSSKNRKQVFEFYKDKLKRQIDDAFRAFRASMLQSGEGDKLEVRKEAYLRMKPDDVILEIFGKFSHLMTNIKMRDTSRGQQKQMIRLVEDYVGLLRTNAMFKCMFNLSVCMSNTEVDQTVVEMLKPVTNVQAKTSVEEPVKEVRPPPRKDKVVQLIQTYIERCLNAGSLSLVHLDRIEEKLLEEFCFEEFHEMGYGRFIHFLITEMKQILEEGGGLTLGSNPGAAHDSRFKPELTEIQEFIKQCQACGISQSEEIENALCKHYGVKAVHHLGYGNMTRLLSHAEKHRLSAFSDFTIYYQSAFIQPLSFCTKNQKVGVLGHQTKDLAKICLHNCPLLEDLAEWSQWSLVFEPELGKLKDFVQKYGGVTSKTLEDGRVATLDFFALETKPGVLLKIVSNTSAELVAEALERRDIITFCGHLVSMVISYKGVSNLPKALLAGHVKTALLQLHASDPESETPGAPSTFISQNSACQFVLQCLLRIPTQTCVDLADDLLLSPLGQVVGSTKFKQILVQLCNSVKELNHLTELGCLLGIQEWTNHVSQKCVLLESSIQKLSPASERVYDKEPQDKMSGEERKEEENENETPLQHMVVDEDITALDDNMEINDDKNSDAKVIQDNVIESESTAEATDRNQTEHVFMETELKKVTVHERVRTCEDIIDEIRREEFGVGVQLSEDGQRLMKVQQERLGRSLDRLSKDLYSKDTHFVLELIQNADDNSYQDNLLSNIGDVCPSVKFVIDEDSVCVHNNELGFKERDIRALCDVGRSTKGKHKVGYIGQKGIGFKSVFRVTDTPEIHSNGFHMKFDVNSGPMGYILPHWSELTDRVDDRWTTNIILSLKPDMRLHTRTLAARFNDIHPSLLLFLHRLREITIENKVENKVQTMRRRDVGENIIEIQHSDGLDRWLVIKKMLDASKISSQAKSGADVESTEIALAFPVKPATQMSNMQGLPPKQLVFAFLPLRSYGFRFIVQGDFDVPSSREDVDRDSSWNQWLRNEIHTLFLDSLDMFKGHEEFSSVEAVISYLQFVPMEDEVLDFFKPVASDILKKLKARPCVPTQPNSEGVISWKIPSQTVRVRDPLVRSVITADLLQKHLNLHYLHPDVASMLNPTLTSCLGIETLTSEHLFHLGKALIVKMEEYAKPEDVLLIARWLACIYRSLDEFQDDDSILSTLKSLQMLPLSDGKLVSLQADTVFYPIPNLDESSKGGRDPLYYLQQDVNSLHPLLLKTDDDEVNSQVHKLLLRLGIKQLSPFDVINHHVIPVLKSEAWKNKSKATIISYIIYVKEQTEKQNNVCNMDEIKDIAQVITNKGIKNPNKEPVHFSRHYGNTIDLQKTFPGYEWTVVDPIYLPPQPSHLTLVSWHDFFLKLGVEDYFSVQKREVRLKREELETSIWKNEVGFWPQGETEYVIQDYYSEELEALITKNKYTTGEQFQGQMRALCLCFEKMWDSKFSRYTKTNCCDTNGRVLKETNTSLSILLQTSCWLPALQCFCYGEPDGNVRMSKTIEMKEPAAIFIHSDRLKRLLSNKVLYLDVQLSLNSTFHQFLGLKNSVNTETVKEYLLQWCARSEDNVPAVFSTSLSHMKQVYSYLSQELNIGNLQNLLRDHPIYFVPLRPCGPDDLVAGQMLNRKEIWLADRTGLFDKYRGLLEEFHSEICKKRTLISFYSNTPDLLKIFRQEGKIDQQPQVEEYMELLSLLCTTSLPKDVAVFSDVLYIFTMIGQALAHPPEAPNEETANMMQNAMKEKVKKKIQKEKVLPTKKGLWVSLNDKPMIADNRDWEKMFADKDKVHFLDLEDKQGHSKHRQARHGRSKMRGPESSIQPEMIDVFIEVCEVKSLSNCVAMEVTPGLLQPCFKIQQYFHDIVPIMQQYLSAKFEESYKELEHQNTKQIFTDAKFYQTGKLEVIYRLNITGNETFEVREEKCVISPPTFYFHCDHVNSIAEVNREIARHFSGGNSACNTALRGFLLELHTTLTAQDGSDSVEMLLQRHDADDEEIPENEVWEVEPPALPEPEPEPEPIEEFPEVDLSRKKKSSNKDEPFELRVWPTVASEDRNKPKEKSEAPTSNIWPPPQAKDYMRSLKELPSNILMAAPDNGKSEPSEENTENRPRSSEPQPTGRSTVVTAHPGPSGDGQGQGQPGNLGYSNVNQENVLTIGSASDIPRKRKLSDEKGVEDAQSVKRHSSEQKLTIDSIEMSENGQIVNPEQSHEHREKRDREKNDEGQRETTHDSSSVPKYSSPDGHARSPHRQTQSPEKGWSNIIGDPVWTRMASEYTYDELGSGAELSTVLTLLDSDGNPEIGRWGENLVACYLQRQKEAGNIIDFEWSNHQNETGAPYDFLVHFADDEGIHEDYIEVKSTVSDDKEVFEISVQQIKFAEEKKGNFHIYRVFNAGNPEKVRLIRIFDLDLRLSQKQVRLCMLI